MTLQAACFVAWAVLWIVYFVLDGADLGAAVAIPFLARNDRERTAMFAVLGPVWNGNEAWLVGAGGVTFAAFPRVCAAMFSTMYWVVLLLFLSLVLRGAAVGFRGHRPGRVWRRFWEGALSTSSLAAALLLGVAFGNLWRGLPVDAGGRFHGEPAVLLNSYALAVGALVLILFVQHGCLWIAGRTTGPAAERAAALSRECMGLAGPALLFVMLWSAFGTRLFTVFVERPVLLVLPALPVVGIAVAIHMLKRRAVWRAWGASAVVIATVLGTGFAGIYPALLPARRGIGLTAFNASSNPETLKVVLVAGLIFVPAVIAYQAWARQWAARAGRYG